MTHRTVYGITPLKVEYERLPGEAATSTSPEVPQDIELGLVFSEHNDSVGALLSTWAFKDLHAHVLAELQAEWKIEEKSL
jgi:hypothetical protein